MIEEGFSAPPRLRENIGFPGSGLPPQTDQVNSKPQRYTKGFPKDVGAFGRTFLASLAQSLAPFAVCC
jgi:hypothetical protein